MPILLEWNDPTLCVYWIRTRDPPLCQRAGWGSMARQRGSAPASNGQSPPVGEFELYSKLNN